MQRRWLYTPCWANSVSQYLVSTVDNRWSFPSIECRAVANMFSQIALINAAFSNIQHICINEMTANYRNNPTTHLTKKEIALNKIHI